MEGEETPQQESQEMKGFPNDDTAAGSWLGTMQEGEPLPSRGWGVWGYSLEGRES